jgi:predicted nucleotidyltransferase component of viral defense system
MNTLDLHERFEMETLDEMRKARVLSSLVFGGGTMLRLCHQLPRYSVDLDFYVKNPKKDFDEQFKKLCTQFEKGGVEITDRHEKHFTYLIEIRKTGAPRRLKIEIRKEDHQAALTEPSLAFSSAAPDLQVSLISCSLEQMATNKIEALQQRKLARDAFDLEFLMRRGVNVLKGLESTSLSELLKIVKGFTPKEIIHTLGTLLPPQERERLAKTSFSLLEGLLAQTISS